MFAATCRGSHGWRATWFSLPNAWAQTRKYAHVLNRDAIHVKKVTVATGVTQESYSVATDTTTVSSSELFSDYIIALVIVVLHFSLSDRASMLKCNAVENITKT